MYFEDAEYSQRSAAGAELLGSPDSCRCPYRTGLGKFRPMIEFHRLEELPGGESSVHAAPVGGSYGVQILQLHKRSQGVGGPRPVIPRPVWVGGGERVAIPARTPPGSGRG